MATRIFLFVAICFISGSCTRSFNNDGTNHFEKSKAEIIQVEKEFADMAKEKGLAEAFEYYAAEDGVISRDTLYIGKKSIYDYHVKQTRPGISLTWTPDFVDVASSGDLGYTYGHYSLSVTDSLGNIKTSNGVFHTVWKRQPDGSWRFVWD